jgi:hypothetical protein
MVNPREATRDLFYTQKAILFILVPILTLMLAFTKREALNYGAITLDFNETSALVVGVIDISSSPEIYDAVYSFRAQNGSVYHGKYRVDGSSTGVSVGDKLQIAYSGYFPEHSTLLELYPTKKTSFIIFVSSIIGLILVIAGIIYLTIKIERHKQQSRYY